MVSTDHEEDHVNFCGLLRKAELHLLYIDTVNDVNNVVMNFAEVPHRGSKNRRNRWV